MPCKLLFSVASTSNTSDSLSPLMFELVFTTHSQLGICPLMPTHLIQERQEKERRLCLRRLWMKSSGRSPFILHRAHDAQPEHAAAFTNRGGDSWDIARTIHSSSSSL
jgi:hypothetical protein